MSIAPPTSQPRSTYFHLYGCKAVTRVGLPIAQQLADLVDSVDFLYCAGCRKSRSIYEFAWVDHNGHGVELIRQDENADG